MKKALFAVLLTLAVVACGQKKDEAKAEVPAVVEEVKNEIFAAKFENSGEGTTKFNSTITSEDNFENAKLTYSVDGGEEKTVDLKRFEAASGIGLKSEDGTVEFMFKGEEGIAVIDAVEYTLKEVK